MALLSDADKQRIEAKVVEIERQTAGELVVSVVEQSDDYLAPRIGYAAISALALSGLAHIIWVELDATWLLAIQLGLAVGLFALLGQPWLLRKVVPAALLGERVEQRAERMFLSQAVFDTRDHTGVLILLSELEHRAVILGDRGIHARVEQQGWAQHVVHIVNAIRKGKPADGICEVLDELGVLLSREFPRREDDTNELSDRVVDERRPRAR
jgi:putative membrane protein